MSSRPALADRAAVDEGGLDGAVADVHADDHGAMIGPADRGGLRYHRLRRRSHGPAGADRDQEGCVSFEPPAKFFVNSGLASNPVDIYHLLRPLLRQTVAYRYLRAGKRRRPRHRLGGAHRGRPAGRLLLLHAALDLPLGGLLGAPRVRDAARPAHRLHARPGRRARRPAVRAGARRRRGRGRPGAAALPGHARLHPDGARRLGRRRVDAERDGREPMGRRVRRGRLAADGGHARWRSVAGRGVGRRSRRAAAPV